MNERYFKVYYKVKSIGRLPEQSSSYLIKATSKEEAKEKFFEQAKKEYRSICKFRITRVVEED